VERAEDLGEAAVGAAPEADEVIAEAVGDFDFSADAGEAAIGAAEDLGEAALDATRSAAGAVAGAAEAVWDEVQEAVAAAPAVEEVLESAEEKVEALLTSALEYIEGIGPVFARKLEEIGIRTPRELLEWGAFPKGRTEIADRSGISGKRILEWVNHVDLYRIKGVGSEYADLLEASGVDTVVELATRNPANLYQKLVAVNEEKRLVRKLPTASQVEDWVQQAKGLSRIIHY
jgi:predicted flap endonuclease-1-like 5' DNA nuclease